MNEEAREYLDKLIDEAIANTTDPKVAQAQVTSALFKGLGLGAYVELQILRHAASGWLLQEIERVYKRQRVAAKIPNGIEAHVPSRLAARIADPRTGVKRTKYVHWGHQLTFAEFEPFAAWWQGRADKMASENAVIQHIRDVFARHKEAESAYEAFRVAGLPWPLED